MPLREQLNIIDLSLAQNNQSARIEVWVFYTHTLEKRSLSGTGGRIQLREKVPWKHAILQVNCMMHISNTLHGKQGLGVEGQAVFSGKFDCGPKWHFVAQSGIWPKVAFSCWPKVALHFA